MTAPSSANESFLTASHLRRWWWWAGTTISSSPRSLTTCYLLILVILCNFANAIVAMGRFRQGLHSSLGPLTAGSVSGSHSETPLREDDRPVLTWSECQRLSTSPEAGPPKGSFSILQPPPDLPARSGDVAVHKGDLRHSCSWTILKFQINHSTCPITNSSIILR
ncbi:hypothetical protein EDB81DRAFT_774014, partial [Dactylonectria macrodidyma]